MTTPAATPLEEIITMTHTTPTLAEIAADYALWGKYFDLVGSTPCPEQWEAIGQSARVQILRDAYGLPEICDECGGDPHIDHGDGSCGIVWVLSLPDRGTAVEKVVRELWDDLQIVDDAAVLAVLMKKPKNAERLAPFSTAEILAAIEQIKHGKVGDKPVKQVEIEALLAAPEGFGLPPTVPRTPGCPA